MLEGKDLSWSCLGGFSCGVRKAGSRSQLVGGVGQQVQTFAPQNMAWSMPLHDPRFIRATCDCGMGGWNPKRVIGWSWLKRSLSARNEFRLRCQEMLRARVLGQNKLLEAASPCLASPRPRRSVP